MATCATIAEVLSTSKNAHTLFWQPHTRASGKIRVTARGCLSRAHELEASRNVESAAKHAIAQHAAHLEKDGVAGARHK